MELEAYKTNSMLFLDYNVTLKNAKLFYKDINQNVDMVEDWS